MSPQTPLIFLPPLEEVTCCAVAMVTTSVPQPILAIRAQLKTKHLCKGV